MEGGADPEEESMDIARSIAYGWPSVDREPTGVRQGARFVKAFPLKFPMGIGDLHEERIWKVSGPEWLQHLLRFWTGHFVDGQDCHRCVWAMVNSVLMAEAAGKGFAVHRNVMRRLGGRVVVVRVGSLPRLIFAISWRARTRRRR